MDLSWVFFNSFIVGFSGAMMPGPLLVVGISETPRHGWRTGIIISVGHAIAEIGVVLVLVLGLAAFAKDELVTQVIAIVGGAALILMGLSMGRDILKNSLSYDSIDSSQKGSRRLLAGKGITATLSNPFWFVWWGTVGLSLLVDSQRLGTQGPIVFYFGHILSDFVWYTAVSIILWSGRKLFVGKVLKSMILACAVFLIYLGITFLITGLSSFT
ncbi:MAG: LysE family transporter [candidate division Zixibacteria bacterium]|nr:LysE family transporter [candidate division Zixibacteria bacterium]